MKLRIFTVAAVVAALLYAPHRNSGGEVFYTWIFDGARQLDVALLLMEFAMIGLFAFVVYRVGKALDSA